ncbi:MAG: Crp/Fnr family transcriptional regulator [Saprospiraceae bacterium]|nr:Crp/Fnr family transcriptional regulator [Saprospiraceae bacterium]
MPSKILEYIAKFVKLDEEEALLFCNSFKEVKVKKRQFIVQPNFTAKHRNYVLKGAFRAYVIGDEGQDHTINIAIDDWWITDYNSYIYQQPATLFVVALEDSTVLQIDYDKEQSLKKQNHKFETFFRIIAERGLAFQQRRLLSNLTQSAEERYEHFVSNYPQIVHRVPQYALASYLGMTTEFLSRIRNKRISKKS